MRCASVKVKGKGGERGRDPPREAAAGGRRGWEMWTGGPAAWWGAVEQRCVEKGRCAMRGGYVGCGMWDVDVDDGGAARRFVLVARSCGRARRGSKSGGRAGNRARKVEAQDEERGVRGYDSNPYSTASLHASPRLAASPCCRRLWTVAKPASHAGHACALSRRCCQEGGAGARSCGGSERDRFEDCDDCAGSDHGWSGAHKGRTTHCVVVGVKDVGAVCFALERGCARGRGGDRGGGGWRWKVCGQTRLGREGVWRRVAYLVQQQHPRRHRQGPL